MTSITQTLLLQRTSRRKQEFTDLQWEDLFRRGKAMARMYGENVEVYYDSEFHGTITTETFIPADTYDEVG